MPADSQKDPRSSEWYNEDIKEVPNDIRKLLEGYSGIAPDRIVPHVLRLRSKAFDVCPYPCIGQFKFLILTLSSHPLYAEIVTRMKQGHTFLDFGCCFGQDLRQLVADGAPSENTYGIDIEGPLIDIGYELFVDREKLRTTFIVGDAYDPKVNWEAVNGKINIINASAFFHLFPWPKQVEACCLLVKFGRPQPGTVIIGRQMGSLTPAEFPSLIEGTTGFRHDPETLAKLWNEVGELTGTVWKIHATLDMVGIMGKGDSEKDARSKPAWAEPNMRRLLFTITRQ
ncbi:hypothetical protein MMC13_002953 [Lambiella insularis]|nr:hypothetical protein [Lambiella insularis]